ncbi:hypothetical protein [Methanopyrus kandleri]
MSGIHSDLKFVFRGGGGYTRSEKVVTARELEKARREYRGRPVPL